MVDRMTDEELLGKQVSSLAALLIAGMRKEAEHATAREDKPTTTEPVRSGSGDDSRRADGGQSAGARRAT